MPVEDFLTTQTMLALATSDLPADYRRVWDEYLSLAGDEPFQISGAGRKNLTLALGRYTNAQVIQL